MNIKHSILKITGCYWLKLRGTQAAYPFYTRGYDISQNHLLLTLKFALATEVDTSLVAMPVQYKRTARPASISGKRPYSSSQF